LTSPALYGEALSLFLPVFETLEAIMDRNAKHPHLGKLYPLIEDLRRTPGFRADFIYYLAKERREELEAAWKNGEHKAIAEYVTRLEELEKSDPVLLLAYAYHLYGGIVAGGQIIARMVRKAMGLPKDSHDGVEVFRVKEGRGKILFQKVKAIYNEEIDLSTEQKEALIKEGREVFRLNDALVATVKGTPAWSLAAESLLKRLVVICCLPVVLYFAWHVFSLGSGGVLQHGY
jgi:heme oxygenase